MATDMDDDRFDGMLLAMAQQHAEAGIDGVNEKNHSIFSVMRCPFLCFSTLSVPCISIIRHFVGYVLV